MFSGASRGKADNVAPQAAHHRHLGRVRPAENLNFARTNAGWFAGSGTCHLGERLGQFDGAIDKGRIGSRVDHIVGDGPLWREAVQVREAGREMSEGIQGNDNDKENGADGFADSVSASPAATSSGEYSQDPSESHVMYEQEDAADLDRYTVHIPMSAPSPRHPPLSRRRYSRPTLLLMCGQQQQLTNNSGQAQGLLRQARRRDHHLSSDGSFGCIGCLCRAWCAASLCERADPRRGFS